MEDKLNQAHMEVQQLKASVKNYEGMIDNYKSQVIPSLPCHSPAQVSGRHPQVCPGASTTQTQDCTETLTPR